jgi:hypothetical protein
MHITRLSISKHSWKTGNYSNETHRRQTHGTLSFRNIYRVYRACHDSVQFIFNLITFVDRLTTRIFIVIEQCNQIIAVVHGWLLLIRSICSGFYLIASRLMILSATFYQIFHLLAILLEPVANRSIENVGRTFSRFLFDYYSSNGACYTLRARTSHIVNRVRTRWRQHQQSLDIYYDALDYQHIDYR